MASLFRSCDIFLGPSRSDEGFGLPAAEAMASGVPTVLSDIPSFRAFDRRNDFALFSPEDDAESMGLNLATLLQYPEMQESLRIRGREVVQQFRRDAFRKRFLEVVDERLNAAKS
jgi:glycosyltransferase involved in cell wall biosynthesis